MNSTLITLLLVCLVSLALAKPPPHSNAGGKGKGHGQTKVKEAKVKPPPHSNAGGKGKGHGQDKDKDESSKGKGPPAHSNAGGKGKGHGQDKDKDKTNKGKGPPAHSNAGGKGYGRWNMPKDRVVFRSGAPPCVGHTCGSQQTFSAMVSAAPDVGDQAIQQDARSGSSSNAITGLYQDLCHTTYSTRPMTSLNFFTGVQWVWAHMVVPLYEAQCQRNSPCSQILGWGFWFDCSRDYIWQDIKVYVFNPQDIVGFPMYKIKSCITYRDGRWCQLTIRVQWARCCSCRARRVASG